jgi:hypothetical protein
MVKRRKRESLRVLFAVKVINQGKKNISKC